MIRLLLIFTLMLITGQVTADEIRVAVASNFSKAITALSKQFEDKTQHKVTLSFGSTGKHYAQIKNGAPFDIFFAADVKRPELLDQEGIAVSDSRFTYAIGKLILWSPNKDYIDAESKVLEQMEFQHLAIANPKLAPYGKAAKEFLQAHGLWDMLRPKMVRGENIGQAFQFVNSGNAKLGLVAYSQIKHPDQTITGSYWEVPQSLYSPIEQQAVLLKNAQATQDFLTFIKTQESQNLIQSFGYNSPNAK